MMPTMPEGVGGNTGPQKKKPLMPKPLVPKPRPVPTPSSGPLPKHRDVLKPDESHLKKSKNGYAKGNDYQRYKRRMMVADMYLSNMTAEDIATILDVNVATVRSDLNHATKEWREKMLASLDTQKANELAKIDRVEQAAWDAWIRSTDGTKQKIKEVTLEPTPQFAPRDPANPKAPGAIVGYTWGKTQEVVKEMHRSGVGDPKFLEIIQKCVDQRIKLLRLVAEDEEKDKAVQKVDWDSMIYDADTREIIDPVIEKLKQLPAYQSGQEDESGSLPPRIVESESV